MTRKGELPHCVSACPNGVFYFGDMNEDVVTNGSETVRFSELIRDVFGPDAGVGARSAVGVPSLPAGWAVEIETIFEIEGE